MSPLFDLQKTGNNFGFPPAKQETSQEHPGFRLLLSDVHWRQSDVELYIVTTIFNEQYDLNLTITPPVLSLY